MAARSSSPSQRSARSADPPPGTPPDPPAAPPQGRSHDRSHGHSQARSPGRRPPDPVTVEVVDLIGSVVARYHAEYELAAAHHALTGAQARLLALLTRNPTPMRKVAEQLKCEPSNVTGIVDRLESRGLVERRPDPADRRVKLAAATDKGAETAVELRASLGFAREPLAELTTVERTLLRDLLQRVLGEAAGDEGVEGEAGTGGGSGAPGKGTEGPGERSDGGAGEGS